MGDVSAELWACFPMQWTCLDVFPLIHENSWIVSNLRTDLQANLKTLVGPQNTFSTQGTA